MGKKKRLFIDKVLGKDTNVCDKCGEAIRQVRTIKAQKSENSYRYDKKIQGVCACNRDKIIA